MKPTTSKIWLPIVLASLVLLATSTPAHAHVRHGHFIVVEPFGYYPYGFYPYGPFYQYHATTGTLKLKADPKGEPRAEVFLNGALAAELKHKHTLELLPGEYKIELHKAGYQSVSRSVYITAGQTIEIDFVLVPAA